MSEEKWSGVEWSRVEQPESKQSRASRERRKKVNCTKFSSVAFIYPSQGLWAGDFAKIFGCNVIQRITFFVIFLNKICTKKEF